MLQVLTFTTLFPNSVEPRHGVFVEERLRHLLATGEVEPHIVAPVPWFPFTAQLFGRYAGFANVPAVESRLDLPVQHPRYLTIPKLGMAAAPALMARSLRRRVRRLCEEVRIQLIDSHFLYPDGVAAWRLGREIGVPVLMTARGSDINLFMRFREPRRQILEAARGCARVITVSDALRDALIGHGVDPSRVVTLRNGVDLDQFKPGDRAQRRAALGMTRPTVLSVGNLFELKGHQFLIGALPELPGVQAVVIGNGPWRQKLAALARDAGVDDRVRFIDNLPREELVRYYQAADALLLASSREGMPNVVLESLACGTPVVATPVGGVPEIIDHPAAGMLLEDRSTTAVASALSRLLAAPPDPAAVAAHGARFAWQPTIDALLALFQETARPARAGNQ